MRRTSRFSRAACLSFFVAALVAHGASTTPALAESTGRCSDESFYIDLVETEDANLGQDAEERVEQLRDWLWPLLLARLEATTKLEGLLIDSATQPLIRDDALAHVLDLPVGSTRSGTAKDGTVVVMVQDAGEAAMQEAVLEAIDQEALHLGSAPQQAIVYRYTLDEREGHAEMCRLGTFDASWIESRSHGFRRATVQTTGDLESFLDGGIDLLTAQCTEQGLEVTGRSQSRARKVPMTVEHVASLRSRGWEQLGFSLDPKIRAREAARDLGILIEAMGDAPRLAARLHAWNVEPAGAAALVRNVSMLGGVPESVRQALLDLQSTLHASSDHEALGILTKAKYLSGSPEQEFASLVASLLHEHSTYQCARYDGPLQGTRTGMTMFYTDLLMKLWSGDRFDSAPEGLIPGFESVVGHELSSAYCTEEEDKYPSTRAWLGLREEQYAREGAARVRFAPVATRVFIMGSAYGAEYSEEVEASAAMRRFYRWWNAHYARVAAWEPQYELLNQIMKWSVVVQVDSLAEDRSCLGFLDEVSVDRGQRFDQWVVKQPALRWRGPVSLVKLDEPTECLPTLRTRPYPDCGTERHLIGGVSTASRATVAAKPLQRPPGRLEGTPTVATDGRVTYQSVVRPDGKLTQVQIDPAQRTFSARVEAGASQRGARHSYGVGGNGGERSVAGVKKSQRLDRGRLDGRDSIDTSESNFGVGHLHADDVTGRMILPNVAPGPVTQMRNIGQTAAARMAGGRKSLSEVAPDLPGVTSSWQLPDRRVMVEITSPGGGPAKYGLMRASGGTRGPPGSLRGRFGHEGGGRSGPVEVSLVPDQQARQMLSNATRLPGGRNAALQPKLARALDDGDLVTARRVIDRALARGADPALVKSELAQAHRRAVWQGRDTRGLEHLQLRTSIKHGKPHAPVRELSVLPTNGTDFLVPRSHATGYSELVHLPSGPSPALRAGASRPAFHARLVENSSTLSDVPRRIRLDGMEYVRLQRPGMTAAGQARMLYIIHPCRRDGEGESSATVECHGRTTAQQKEEIEREYLRTQACRLDERLARTLGVGDCRQGTRQ
jgi:hypothetical protein